MVYKTERETMKTQWYNARARAGQVVAAGKNAYLRAGVALGSALAGSGAMAQATNPIDDIFDAIDLSSVTTKVGALALVIIGITMLFKGTDLGKRAVKKV
jgi:mannose/cellobiose epimerase-like protein (N-acyl-D-glucosamine 2-epimerase family)